MSLARQEASAAVWAAPHASLHELEGGGVLFDAQRKRLYAFNDTATFIWRRIEDGLAPPAIVAQMSRDFAVAPETAAEFVAGAVRCWEELSLLSARAPQVRPRAPSRADTAVSPRPVDVPDRVERVAGRTGAGELARASTYRLFDMCFVVQTDDPAVAALAADFLRPLACPAGEEAPTVIEIATTGDGAELSAEGIVLERCERTGDLPPLLKTCLVELALGRSRGIGALHAAAVAGPHGAVLLPARSGEGKSTLTAALVEAGYRLLADDTVALTDAVEARPAPFAICLKEGAWTLLAPRFPELTRAPTHRRMDGKMVRYLFPRSADRTAPPDARYPIRWAVFLHRAASETARLVPLSKAEALTRLTAEFSPLEGGLSEPQIARFVQWIGSVDCCELRFAEVDDAVEQMSRLCGAPDVTGSADRR